MLNEGDIEACLGLSTAAGWNQTGSDWARLMRLSPDLCYGIDVEGTLAATTTALCYGRELAWIGMVLTAERYRQRGLARTLVTHILTLLAEKGIAWAKLDASDQGEPLYRQFGFEQIGRIERWSRLPSPPVAPVELASHRDIPDAFSVNREPLLQELAVEQASIAGGAFALGRPGTRAAYFGPCVAHSPESAATLLNWFLARHPDEPVYWDLFPDNRAAVTIAEARGFTCLRRLPRMALALMPGAPPIRDDVERQYAIAGPEYG